MILDFRIRILKTIYNEITEYLYPYALEIITIIQYLQLVKSHSSSKWGRWTDDNPNSTSYSSFGIFLFSSS